MTIQGYHKLIGVTTTVAFNTTAYVEVLKKETGLTSGITCTAVAAMAADLTSRHLLATMVQADYSVVESFANATSTSSKLQSIPFTAFTTSFPSVSAVTASTPVISPYTEPTSLPSSSSVNYSTAAMYGTIGAAIAVFLIALGFAVYYMFIRKTAKGLPKIKFFQRKPKSELQQSLLRKDINI